MDLAALSDSHRRNALTVIFLISKYPRAETLLRSVHSAWRRRQAALPRLPPACPLPRQQLHRPTAPPGAPNMVRLQFPNSDVADVLHLYEDLTGKKLVMDNFVQGKVNIFIAKEVPREEAIKIIEINLLMNGFSLVPAGRRHREGDRHRKKSAHRRRADHFR